MAHLLPAVAAAQALGIVAADRLDLAHAPCWLAAGALAAGAACVRAPRTRTVLVVLAAFAVGAASLAGRLDAAARGPAAPRALDVEATAVRVDAYGEARRVDWAGVAALAPGATAPPRMRLHGRWAPSVPAALQTPLPGERWRLRVRLARPQPPRNPGAPDRERRLARRGIGATGARLHPGLGVRVGRAGEGPLRDLRRWRAARAERLAALGPPGGLLAALGLGDRRALSDDARDDFARLGLAHLLAVSGLHLSLVAAAGFGLARAVLVRVPGVAARHDARRLALVAALPAATGYAVLSGFGLPAQRAAVLLLAAALALGLRRPRRRAAPLALASFALLARAPHELFEPGFQLSFAATAALLAARPGGMAGEPGPEAPRASWVDGLRRAGGGVARAADGVARASASALLATAPGVAWHFGRGAPLGLLANLVAVPATALALLPASAAAVLAAGGEGWPAIRVLEAARGIAWLALRGAELAAAGLPPAGGAPEGAVAPATLAVAVALAIVGVRCAGTRARLAVLGAQTVWLALASPPAIAPAPPRLVALDVGQGDAVLVEGRRGVLLVDAGRRLPSGFDAGERHVAPALAALGVARVDRLAVSHGDLDHRGGVPAVLERLDVGAVWLPRGGAADPAFDALRAAAARRGVPVEERGAGDPAETVGDLAVAFLGPGGARASRNDASLVLRVAVAGRTVLLPGDVGAAGEGALLAGGAPLTADVLLLPHHGSGTSSGARFLDAVAPGLAIVSAPCRGRFPMPHPDVRSRLAARGLPLRWTGRDGAVLVGLGDALRVRVWGAPRTGCFGADAARDGAP